MHRATLQSSNSWHCESNNHRNYSYTQYTQTVINKKNWIIHQQQNKYTKTNNKRALIQCSHQLYTNNPRRHESTDTLRRKHSSKQCLVLVVIVIVIVIIVIVVVIVCCCHCWLLNCYCYVIVALLRDCLLLAEVLQTITSQKQQSATHKQYTNSKTSTRKQTTSAH